MERLAYAQTTVFQCTPVSYEWNKLIPGTCVNVPDFYRSYSPQNIVTDLLILALPIPTVWKLNASWPKKLGLTFIFLTSIV